MTSVSAVTISWSPLLAVTILAFSVQIGCQSILGNNPWQDGLYHTEIIYPNGQLQGSLTFRNYPLSITNGYHFNQIPVQPFLPPRFPPPPVQLQRYLPPIPIPRQQPKAGNYFQPAPAGISRLPPPSAASLFTPATIKQPAETLGQIEAYRKALREQAEQDEKERQMQQQQQDEDTATLSGAFTDSDLTSTFPATTLQPTSYVDVQVDGDKQYKYSYAV